MKVIAISTAMVAACVIVYQLPAQPRSTLTVEAQQPADQSLIARRLQFAREGGFEERATAIGAEFGKALSAAIQEEVLKPDQANALLNKLELTLAIKRARLDLLRVTAALDKAGAKMEGGPHMVEFMQLRQQLRAIGGDLQPRNVPTAVPQQIVRPAELQPDEKLVDDPFGLTPGLRATEPKRTDDPFGGAKPQH